MKPKDVIPDETVFRELKDRFGSPFGFGASTSAAAWAPRRCATFSSRWTSRRSARDLEEQVKTAKGQKQSRAVKRLKVVSAFINSDNRPENMILEAVPVIPPELRPMVASSTAAASRPPT